MEGAKLLQNLTNLSSYGSSDSDSDSDEGMQQSFVPGKVTTKKSGEGRLPTRRPNPNVYNRNALLARENRRKKKAYVEEIERELRESQMANKKLKKALKVQLRAVNRLEREKRYFQSIIANRSEIAGLVKALNVHLPLQQSNENGIEQLTLTQSHLSPHASLESNGGASGRSSSYELETFSTNLEQSDNDLGSSSVFSDPWSDLLRSDLDFNNSHNTLQETSIENKNNITEEHSYVDLQQDPVKELTDTGVCLHIAHGKVSLEFCPSCYWNANRTSNSEV